MRCRQFSRATRRCALLLLLLAFFIVTEETIYVQRVLAKEATDTVSSTDDIALKAGEKGTPPEVGTGAPPVAVAPALRAAARQESNKEKEKEYAERRSKVYARVEFSSFVLQKSPLEDEFCIYDVQKEGTQEDEEGEKIGPVPLLKKREKTEREVLPSLKAYKTSVQEQLQQKRALEKKAKKATKSGENSSSSSSTTTTTTTAGEQPVVVVENTSEKDGTSENTSASGEEREDSTKLSTSVSDDATLSAEIPASSSSTTVSSAKKASDGDDMAANEKSHAEKKTDEKVQIENKKKTASSESLSESNRDKETATNSWGKHAVDVGIKKATDETELTRSASEKSEESQTSSSDVNAASSENGRNGEKDIDKRSGDDVHKKVADANENKDTDRQERNVNDAKEDGTVDDEDDEDDDDYDDDIANRIILPQSVTKEDREKYNLASIRNGAKVISSNEESKHASAMLSEDMDSYYISPCNAESKWVTVELSEEATLTQVIVADYEFHSSGMHEFEIWGTDGHHSDKDGWKKLATCEASRSREPQKFSIPANEWVRYVQLRFLTHFGSHHFCTVSLFRVHGKDAKETLREEMERLQEEVEEVEQLFRETDETEAEEAEAAVSSEEGENNNNDALDDSFSSDAAPADAADEIIRDEKFDDDDDADDDDVENNENATASLREGNEDLKMEKNPKSSSSKSSSQGESVDAAKYEKNKKGKEEEGNASRKDTSPPNDGRATGAAKSPHDARERSGTSTSSSPRAAATTATSSNATSTKEVPEAAAQTSEEENSNASSTVHMKSSSSLSNQTKSSDGGSSPTEGTTTSAAAAATAAAAAAASQPGGGAGKGSENVFRKLAQKVKDLELNQSVLDRYIESLNERYAGALDDLNKEIDEIAAVVTNSSNALNEAARRMEKSASKCDKETERQADRFTKSEHALMGALKEFENIRAQARRRENVILSFMFVILTGMIWNATGLGGGISSTLSKKRAIQREAREEEEAEEIVREQQQEQQQNNDLRRVHLSSPDFATHAFRENLFFD